MNAVILAAGVGMRMREVAQNGHKAFLPINNVTIIEKILRYLLEANITDITIVTGHKRELFKPLVKTYGVKLVHNRLYSLNNNLKSLEMVLDKIGDTFIIHADVVLFKNVFKQEEDRTFFYTILKESRGVPQLHPIVNKQRIIQTIETVAGPITETTFLGICFWAKQDALYLKEYFEKEISEKMKRKYHCEWESVILNLIHTFPIEGRQIDRKYARDVNIMRDYYEAYLVYDQIWDKKKCKTVDECIYG